MATLLITVVLVAYLAAVVWAVIDAARKVLERVGTDIVATPTFDAKTTHQTINVALSDVGEVVFLPAILKDLRRACGLARSSEAGQCHRSGSTTNATPTRGTANRPRLPPDAPPYHPLVHCRR